MTNSSSNLYDSAFYNIHSDLSYSSAKTILGSLWRYYTPASVVDVGCGIGTWLKAVSELGVKDQQGLEGAWLTKELSMIPFETIKTVDLSRPFTLSHTFDLAISMEVAEHLPPASAEEFVGSITRLANVVLFSAATPNQPGTGHINGQWPSYWAELFEQKGYVTIDLIRSQVWDDPNVAWWYAQNTLLYVRESFLSQMPSFRELVSHRVIKPLHLVHPKHLAEHVALASLNPSYRTIFFKHLPSAVSGTIAKQFKWMK